MNTFIKSAAILLLAGAAVQAQTIIADNYDVVNVGSGFLANEGVNSGINPPATRLTGTAADGLRYINRASKVDTAYYIGS